MNQPNLYRFGQMLSLIYLISCVACLVSFINSLLWTLDYVTPAFNSWITISMWLFQLIILAIVIFVAVKADYFGLNKLGRIGVWVYAGVDLLHDIIVFSNGFIMSGLNWDILEIYMKIFSGVLLFLSIIILAGKTMLAFGSRLSLLIKILIPSIGLFTIVYNVLVGAFAGYLGGGRVMGVWTSGLGVMCSAVLFVFLLLWTNKQKGLQTGAI